MQKNFLAKVMSDNKIQINRKYAVFEWGNPLIHSMLKLNFLQNFQERKLKKKGNL